MEHINKYIQNFDNKSINTSKYISIINNISLILFSSLIFKSMINQTMFVVNGANKFNSLLLYGFIVIAILKLVIYPIKEKVSLLLLLFIQYCWSFLYIQKMIYAGIFCL